MIQAYTNENDCFVDGSPVVRSGPKVAVSTRRVPTTPCHKCGECGGLWWPDASTWRKSVGGRAITWGVCDQCGGSGDVDHPWDDLRALQAQHEAEIQREAWTYFANHLGTSLPSMKEALARLAEELDKLGQCREARPPYFRSACRLMEDRIRKGLEAAMNEAGKGAS